MGATVDGLRNALRRWLALVRAGNRADYIWRAASGGRDWLGDSGRGDWHADIYAGEAREPQEEAMSVGAALLVHGFAAGPIFISIGTFHYGFFDCDDGGIVL